MAEIKTKAPKAGDRQVSVQYPLGENIQEAVDLYGDDTVYNLYIDKAVVQLQAVIRPMIEAGKTDEEIQSALSTYKLGVKRAAGGGGGSASKSNKLLAALLEMSPEEREAAIADLKAKRAEEEAAKAAKVETVSSSD